MMVAAQSRKDSSSASEFVSNRMVWEMDNAPYEELVELILNTRATVRRVRANPSLSEQQRQVWILGLFEIAVGRNNL